MKPALITRPSHRGFSILELIVVMAILVTLVAVLGASVYGMRKGQAVNAAQTVVGSTLRHARALAIANNAIYHVKFNNVDTTHSATNPPPAAQQYISIYYFPDQHEAAAAFDAADPNIHWEATPTVFRGEYNPMQTYNTDNAVSVTPGATAAVDYYKYFGLSPQVPNPPPPPVLPPIQPPPTNPNWKKISPNFNLLVARYALPEGTYFGVQYTSAPPANNIRRKLLQFHGDGTHWLTSGGPDAVTLFVTDNIKFGDDMSSVDYDVLLQKQRLDFFNEAAVAAGKTSSGKSTHVKITQVLQSGMVREWKPRPPPNQPGDNVLPYK